MRPAFCVRLRPQLSTGQDSPERTRRQPAFSPRGRGTFPSKRWAYVRRLPGTTTHSDLYRTYMTSKNTVISRLCPTLAAGTVSFLRGNHDFRPDVQRASELRISYGCIIWGDCLVVPVAARAQAITLAYACHRGVVAMKRCATSCLWWLQIGKVIEGIAPICHDSQHIQRASLEAPMSR